MKARILDGKIVELLVPVSGFSIEECFHGSVLAQCFDVPDDAQIDDVYVPLPLPLIEPPIEPSNDEAQPTT